jgi:hypothetical protein
MIGPDSDSFPPVGSPMRDMLTALMSAKIDYMTTQLMDAYDAEGMPVPIQCAVFGICLQVSCLKMGNTDLIREAARLLLEGAEKIDAVTKKAGAS